MRPGQTAPAHGPCAARSAEQARTTSSRATGAKLKFSPIQPLHRQPKQAHLQPQTACGFADLANQQLTSATVDQKHPGLLKPPQWLLPLGAPQLTDSPHAAGGRYLGREAPSPSLLPWDFSPLFPPGWGPLLLEGHLLRGASHPPTAKCCPNEARGPCHLRLMPLSDRHPQTLHGLRAEGVPRMEGRRGTGGEDSEIILEGRQGKGVERKDLGVVLGLGLHKGGWSLRRRGRAALGGRRWGLLGRVGCEAHVDPRGHTPRCSRVGC